MLEFLQSPAIILGMAETEAESVEFSCKLTPQDLVSLFQALARVSPNKNIELKFSLDREQFDGMMDILSAPKDSSVSGK